MGKMTIAWILAIIITLVAAYYQRVTGPTYPQKAKVQLNGTEYSFKLPTSGETKKNSRIIIKTGNKTLNARLFYHRYPLNEKDTIVDFTWQKSKKGMDILVAELPSQPVAGKLQYHLKMIDSQNTVQVAKDHPVVIRFKNHVRLRFLLPHILFIFLAMLLSNFTGLLVIFRHPKYKYYMWLTVILLFIGGMILGMIVQKQAFGVYWTGIPFGWDLTDNKLLIGFLVWLIAALCNIKKKRPWMALAAAIILIAVYSIPHSMWGSQLDYKSGKIITG